MYQLDLPFARHNNEVLANQLRSKLEALLGCAAELVVTSNHRRVVSVRCTAGRVIYRIDVCFLRADGPTVAALAEFASGSRPSCRKRLREYAAACKHRESRERSRLVRSSGRVFDLQQLMLELNRKHFEGQLDIRIGWARRSPTRRKKSVRLGKYLYDDRIIMINPILDSSQVPGYFVASVVYHEMLHAFLGVRLRNGRRYVHTPRFRQLEKQYDRFDAAKQWERDNLQLLLGGATALC